MFLSDDLVLLEDPESHIKEDEIDIIEKFLAGTKGDNHHLEYINCLKNE